MEQPPGSLDELQPQDLSTSSIATVIDLSRNGEDRLLNATSLDTLRMVKSPGWFPNSGTSNPGLPFSEAGSSNITLQPGDQIQPDNAFSHTTVTLSYVSRSCVFTTHDSLSRHSPLCGVPSISSLALHPPCDLDEELEDTGYLLKQHYLEQAEAPVGLTAHIDLFQSLSQAQVGPENDDAVCLRRDSHEINGGVISTEGGVDNHLQVQEEHILSQEDHNSLENRQVDSRECSGVCAESSRETYTPITEIEEAGSSEVLFLMAENQVIPDVVGVTDLCLLNPEYISPLEDPVSPSVTTQGDVEDVFVLPQASSPPSADNSYLETTDEAAWNDSSTEEVMKSGSGTSSCTMRSDPSNESGKSVLENLIDLTHEACLSEAMEQQPKTVVPLVNGEAKVLRRRLKEKKGTMCCGRKTRLGTIALDTNSSGYNVSGCIHTRKRARGSSKLTSAKKNSTLSVRKRTNGVKSFSVKEIKCKTLVSLKDGKSNHPNSYSCKDRTSDSDINHSKTARRTSSPKNSPLVAHKGSAERSEQLSQPDPSVERLSPALPSKSPKQSQATGKATGSKTSPTTKTKAARSKRRRHRKSQVVPLFSPREPEIRLKYVHYKEEKRDWCLESFSPYIHVERQQSSPSVCTVINYPEEVRTRPRKGQQASCSGFVSAVVPSTSCLQLGRASTHSQHRRPLVCCLCGLSANTMDLGDLHGPYYPEGYQPSTKTPAVISGVKDDDFSDSESLSFGVRDRGRKRVVPHTPRALRPGAQLQARRRWAADSAGSPVAKRAHSDSGSAHVDDWYSPPVLPLESCEYWLHEDCSVWSTGVFLIKGKVYGLEEAVKAAQETMCSSCCDPGATLGCFFKSCPNKYHYRCAVESGCILVEDNFSMKCKKHKNKTFKGPPGNRWDGS